jgi:hypothetical protein
VDKPVFGVYRLFPGFYLEYDFLGNVSIKKQKFWVFFFGACRCGSTKKFPIRFLFFLIIFRCIGAKIGIFWAGYKMVLGGCGNHSHLLATVLSGNY